MIRLYSATYFDPYNYETGDLIIHENTISIHYYAASWKNSKDMFVYRVGRIIKKIIGEKKYAKIAKLKHKLIG